MNHPDEIADAQATIHPLDLAQGQANAILNYCKQHRLIPKPYILEQQALQIINYMIEGSITMYGNVGHNNTTVASYVFEQFPHISKLMDTPEQLKIFLAYCHDPQAKQEAETRLFRIMIK